MNNICYALQDWTLGRETLCHLSTERHGARMIRRARKQYSRLCKRSAVSWIENRIVWDRIIIELTRKKTALMWLSLLSKRAHRVLKPVEMYPPLALMKTRFCECCKRWLNVILQLPWSPQLKQQLTSKGQNLHFDALLKSIPIFIAMIATIWK